MKLDFQHLALQPTCDTDEVMQEQPNSQASISGIRMMVQDHNKAQSPKQRRTGGSPETMTGVMGHLAGAGLLLMLLMLQSW